MMSISEAQQDMRDAYFGGATGAVTSATVWLIAAIVLYSTNPLIGFATLFFGGMLIFPVALMLCKMLGRSGKHAADNPLGPLAIQGTIWMLLCIPLAYFAGLHNEALFFPAMLLVIGGRYLTFSTLYGMKIYGLLGLLLAFSGMATVWLNAPIVLGAIAGAALEYAFGAAIFVLTRSPPGRA